MIAGAGDAERKSQAGQSGLQALALDGVNDYVAVAPSPTLALDGARFSQAAWVYPQASGALPVIAGGAYAAASLAYPFLTVNGQTRLSFGFGDSASALSGTTGDLLTANAWNHVAAVFDGAIYTIYVNGVERYSTDALSGKTPAPAQRFDIGRDAAAGAGCGRIQRLYLLPLDWNPRGYVVRFNGQTVWSGQPAPNATLSIDGPFEWCGSATAEVFYNMLNGGSLTSVSMGSNTIAATPGPGLASYAGGGLSASLTWEVVAGSALSYFKGQLDDVRIYARALNAFEVQDLYHGGWQVAVPAQTGSSVLATSWSAAAPDGLEGYYRLDLRARDQEGNVSPANPDAWRGDVDTLGPRVSLTQAAVDSLTNRYDMAAQDFNLTETGLQSPCGAGVITGRRYFDSSWYLLTGADDRLYELDSECDLSVYATQNEVGAYATAGLAHSVAVSDTAAYVAAGAAGLQIVDVSDPGQPALTASLAISGTARDVVLDSYPLSGFLSVSAAQPAAAPAQPAPMANQAPAAKPAPGTVVITTPTPAVRTPTPAATTGSARDAGGKPLPAPAAVPHPEQAMLARTAPSNDFVVSAQPNDAGMPGQTPTP